MAKTVVLTGVGRDRVGIVAELTDLLYECGCNLLDSSMTLLRGEFALILMAQLPDRLSIAELEQNLSNIEAKMSFTVHVRELSQAELEDNPMDGDTCIISVYGADRPGIVSGITRKLAESGANISDVETKSTRDSGKPIFLMIIEASLPRQVSADTLRERLAQVSLDLGVDVTVQPIELIEL